MANVCCTSNVSFSVKQQEADTQIWEIKVSTTGQGWTTLMMCKGCLAALNAAIAITVFNSRVH